MTSSYGVWKSISSCSEADIGLLNQLHRSTLLFRHGISKARLVLFQKLLLVISLTRIQDVILFVLQHIILHRSVLLLSISLTLELRDLRAICITDHKVLLAKSHGVSTASFI
jgi:hypothetical protein